LFLTAKGELPWRYGAPAVLIELLLWLLIGTGMFNNRQQALFKLRNRMAASAEIDAARRQNLREALEDLRRLRRVCRQFLDWSAALGTFVRAPWGEASAVDGGFSQMGEGYPLNHRFGVAVPDDTAIDYVVNGLRTELFPVGWLSSAWENYLEDL